MLNKIVELRVSEAIQDDVGKAIVRIDSSFLEKTGVKSGDIIAINGDRKTFAFVAPAYPHDKDPSIIRMDGVQRKNAGTSIGEFVKISKVKLKPAKKVVIAPARLGVIITAPDEIVKQGLLGKPLTKGDIVTLGETKRKNAIMESMENPLFEDVFSILDEAMRGTGFGDVKFIILNTKPANGVVVDKNTEVIFKKEYVEKPKFLENINDYIAQFEAKIKDANKIKELEKLKCKVSKINVRITPKVVRALDRLKVHLIRKIDRKMVVLKKQGSVRAKTENGGKFKYGY